MDCEALNFMEGGSDEIPSAASGLDEAIREGMRLWKASKDDFRFCDDGSGSGCCSGRPRAYPTAETPTAVAVAQS